jgi:hypothetical protein
MFFGYHEMPLQIEQGDISLSCQKEGNNLAYKRSCLEEEIEKTLLTDSGKILLHPVEPLNKPKPISHFLLIEFEKSLVLKPRSKRTIFVIFPVEIAASVPFKKGFEVIDTFSLPKQKFTLYGDPQSGVICRYWKSPVSSTAPRLNPLQEGFIELHLVNAHSDWTEITKSVFNAYSMKLYYNDSLVSMKAKMEIESDHIAETSFIDAPFQKRMTKSFEVYTARKLSLLNTKFVMEYGL